VNQKLLLRLAVMIAGLAVSLPLRAEPLLIAQAVLPPYEILTIVRSAGLDPLSRPARQGSTYALRAIDSYGEEVHVVVGAQRGQILSVQRVVPVAAPYYEAPEPAYRYRYGPRYAPTPEYYEPQTRYDPLPPPAADPRVIRAPRDQETAKPAAKSATPKRAVAVKKPQALPPAAPAETSAAAPAATGPAVAGTAKAETPKPPDAQASEIPPVQTLEK
jgi:hypothetical protein